MKASPSGPPHLSPLPAAFFGLLAAAWTAHAAAPVAELRIGVLISWKGDVVDLKESLLGIFPALETASSILPGYNLTFVWADTQCSTRYAAEAGSALLSSGVDVLIGSPCSGDSLLIAPQTTLYGVPMISYNAIASRLSDKVTYPSFVRVMQSMLVWGESFVAFMRHFGWKHAALIYPGSSGYSTDWAASMRQSFAAASFVTDVDMAYGGSFGVEQVDKLKAAGARIGLWLAYNCAQAHELFVTVYAHGIFAGWAWMTGPVLLSCWNDLDALSAGSLQWFHGVHTINSHFPVEQSSLDWIDSMRQQFTPYIRALTGTAAIAAGLETNPYGFDYNMDQFGPAGLLAALLHDAVLLWAKAARAVLASSGSIRNFTAMRNMMTATSFTGLTGEVELTASGDRKGNGRFDMVSINSTGDGFKTDLTSIYWGVAGELEMYMEDSEFIWAGGHTALPRDHLIMCMAGEHLPNGSEVCVRCPLGRAASAPEFDRPACDKCEPGRFAGEMGQQTCFPCPSKSATSGVGASACSLCSPGYAKDGDTCVPCAPGLFVNSSSQAECQSCPVGRYFAEMGAIECLHCPEGHFSGADGQTACEKCAIGKHSSSLGSSACTSCGASIPDSTTDYLGAVEATECACPPGSFLSRPAPGATGSCKPCLEGLLCLGGNGAPLQAAGFQVIEPAFPGADPPSRLACRSSVVCPGGTELGTCPSHRSGPACDVCELGYFEDDGQCVLCDGDFGAGPFLALVMSASVVVFGLVYYHVVRPVKLYSNTTKTVLLTSALLINALQSITAVGAIIVEWVEPIKSLTRMMQLFSLDLKLLNPGCTLDFNEAWKAYLGTVLGYPCLVSLLLIICSAIKFLKIAQPVSMRAQMGNLQGALMLVLYLPITMVAFEPFRCGWNPDGSSTVLSHRSVVCWNDADHAKMVALAILAILLYLFPFLAICMRATLQLPHMVVSSAGWNFLRQYAFLFDRFAPDRFWWGMVFLARSLSIGIVQANLVNYPVWQVLLFSVVFIANMLAVSLVWPWRTKVANYLDIFLSALLLGIVFGAAVLVRSDDGTQRLLQYFLFIIVAFLFAVALSVLGGNVYSAIAAPKQYAMFLSHHKLGAQALARWMKIVIAEKIPSKHKVFLDSDELRQIDLIVDIVSKRTSNLVVLLTKQTLSRFWCAVEIAVAFSQGINTIPVACNDYIPPSDEFIASLGIVWTKSQQSELASLGMTLEGIAAAYSNFRGREMMALDRSRGLQTQLDAIDHIIRKASESKSRTLITKILSIPSDQAGKTDSLGSQKPVVTITGGTSDPEILCTADIVRRMLQPKLHTEVAILSDDCKTRWQQIQHSKYVLVILSNDVLENALFAATAVFVNRASDIVPVPVITDAPFTFPAETFWHRLQTGELYTLRGVDAVQLQKAYKDVFSLIALSFTVATNQRLLKAQIEEMSDRMPNAGTSDDRATSGQSMDLDAFLRMGGSLPPICDNLLIFGADPATCWTAVL